MKRFGVDKKYLYWGATAFVVIACCILLYLVIMHWSTVAAGMVRLTQIISPFIWGAVIAYLLRPMTALFQRAFLSSAGDALFPSNQRRSFVFSRGAAIFMSEAAMLELGFM